MSTPEYLKKQPLSTPPKLSLYSLPSKPPPDHGLTPPLNTLAMIPFLWEEAPGKPRPTFTKTVVRSLDLPPRLTTTTVSPPTNKVNGVGIEIIPSPTTVLTGPYDQGTVYGSKTVLGSPEKAVVSSKNKGKMRMPLRKLMRKDRSSPPVKFNSWRWDSSNFKDIDRSVVLERSPSLNFCSWRWDSFRDSTGGGASSFDDNIGKVTRKNSFTFANASNTSRFLANMYGTFKKAMPWRSRR